MDDPGLAWCVGIALMLLSLCVACLEGIGVWALFGDKP
jgi:hypothetical protein